jgi:tetratricopeptide (TPR) repeat protein
LTNVEVDTRSDIYSLGVLLYELLTGQTPFAQRKLLAAGLDEMRRTIREVEPPKPSTRLTQELAAGETRESPHFRRSAVRDRDELERLIPIVRGDLDWIVMKCLQKDRARRYETANGLAMDVERHLNHEPVVAGPDTQFYRLAKFVRRHRASATFAALVMFALIVGLTGTITQARRATQKAREADAQRDFALRQLTRAEAINDLNTFLLSDAAPTGKSFTVGELLARAEKVVEKQTADTLDNRVELLISIGHQYEIQDEHGKARELLRKAYDLSRKLTDPSIRARAAAALSVSIALAGECERGEALVREALRECGDAPQFVLHRVFALLRGSRVARECGDGNLGIERAQTAERLLRESNQNSPLLGVTVKMEMAEAYRVAGRNREAAGAFSLAFEELSALGRADTEKAGTLLNNWGVTVEASGQQLEAERLYRKAMAISSADGKNPQAISPMLLTNVARTLSDLHRLTEAAQYAEQADEKARRAGDEHVVNMALNVRTSIYREQNLLDRAAETLAEFEAKTKQLLPPEHVAFATIASQKGMLALARGDAQTALAEANRSIAIAEGKKGARLPFLLLRRASIHLSGGRHDAAKIDAGRALALNQETLGPAVHSSWNGLAHLTIARALTAEGKSDEARKAYASALEHLRPSLGEEHPDTLEAARGSQ